MPQLRRRGGLTAGISHAASNINDFLQNYWNSQNVERRQADLANLQHLNALDTFKMEHPNPDILKQIQDHPDSTTPELVRQSLMGAAKNGAPNMPALRPKQSTWNLQSETNPDGGTNTETGAEVPLKTITQTTPMQQLMDQSLGTLKAQQQQKSASDEEKANTEYARAHPTQAIGPNGETVQTPTPYGKLPGAQTGRTDQQEQAHQQAIASGQQAGNVPTEATVQGKAAVAGAEAKARMPYEKELAQTRANLALLQQKEMEDYRVAHPKLTSDQINTHGNAVTALNLIDENTKLLDEMDKRGMMGPLKSNAAAIASGKIKSEDLFKNPDDAKLSAMYFSQMDLLGKLAAKVHGGARAGASPAMAEQFKKIISATGDTSIVKGQLAAVANVMQLYRDKPEAPPTIAIPGAAAGKPSLDPSIEALLKRGGK